MSCGDMAYVSSDKFSPCLSSKLNAIEEACDMQTSTNYKRRCYNILQILYENNNSHFFLCVFFLFFSFATYTNDLLKIGLTLFCKQSLYALFTDDFLVSRGTNTSSR